MKERIIGVQEVDDSKKMIKDYIIKKLVDGEVTTIKLSNDTKKFQEVLEEYYDFLMTKKGNLLKELSPVTFISNLETNVFAVYLFTFLASLVYSLFLSNSIALLQTVCVSGIIIGIGLKFYFPFLEKKYDNPRAKKELQELEAEIKEYMKILEKTKTALLARETIEKKKAVNVTVPPKQKETKTTTDAQPKKGFQPDRPSFMKNLNVTSNTRIFQQQQVNLRNFSSEPVKFSYRGMGQPVHAHVDVSNARSKSTSNRFNTNYSTNGNNYGRGFNPDRPSFITTEEYERRSGEFENRKKR